VADVSIASILKSAATVDEDARRDAEVILCHVLGKSRSYLYAYSEVELNAEQHDVFDALWQRRCDGEPVAYLTGIKEFWSLEFEVNDQTLVPRPDTEILIEMALERVEAKPKRVLDLGTGSGAVALALARDRLNWNLIGVDIDEASVQLAKRNADRNGIVNAEFRCGSWYEPVANEKFDLIVSNPPYIADDDPWLQSHGVKHEPLRALVSADSGLADIKLIIAGAQSHLKAYGWLMLEHGHEQGAEVRELLLNAGFDVVETVQDLAGLDRVTIGFYN